MHSAMVRARRTVKVSDGDEDGKENVAFSHAFSKDDVKCARNALLSSVKDSTRAFLNVFGAACSNSNVPHILEPGRSIREQRQLLQRALEEDTAKSTGTFAPVFFDHLHRMVDLALARQEYIPESAFVGEDDDESNVDIVLDARSTEGLQFLDCAALCVRVHFLSLPEKSKQSLKIPHLLRIAVALHDILDTLDPLWGPDAAQAHQGIVKLCETWWLQDGESRNDVIGHALPSLVEAAVIKKSDMKRLNVLRPALDVIDFEDSESDSFLLLLLRVASSPMYLKTTEGKRFLSYQFSLGPTVLRKLHSSIRAQIPENKKSILLDYSDVYFSAWKNAPSETARLTFESDVLEDLVHSALHAANPALTASLLTVLSKFHDAKQNTEVEGLLHRLYGPVLWRAVAAANAKVRVNAVKVLAKVFPLQQPRQPKAKSSKSIADSAVHKSCAALRKLLQDPDSRVRAASSEAVAQILAVFWDGIQSDEIRRLLNHVVAEHASDVSSYEVRVGAVNAISILLDAPQTHAVLRDILPKIANLIHDKTEQVRLAVVHMLIQIKKMPNFKYYRVCPLEHLILQLSADGKKNATGSVAVALTSLMVNSYFPDGANVDCAEQIRRTLKFLSEADGAALVFYTNVWRFRSTHAVGQLTFQLLSCLHSLVEGEDKNDRAMARSNIGKRRRTKSNNASIDPSSLEEENETPSADVLASLAETIVVLWKSIETKLQGHKEWNQFLMTEFSGPKLTFVLTHFSKRAKAALVCSDESMNMDVECFYRICSAILQCASMLPSKTVDGLVPYALSVLSATSETDDAGSDENLTAHVALLCLWGMTIEVVSMLSTSIRSAFTNNVLFSGPVFESGQPHRSRSKVCESTVVIPSLRFRVALRILSDILHGSNPNCPSARHAMFSSTKASDMIESALVEGTRQAELILDGHLLVEDTDADYILEVCELYGRFLLHQEAFQNRVNALSKVTMDLLHWTSMNVVPVFERESRSKPAAVPFIDPNLSSILLEKSFDAMGSSPEPISRHQRRANRNKTPERLDDGVRFSFDSPSSLQDKAASSELRRAFATSLMVSSCVLFSEWLAVGGFGAFHVSRAAVNDWCRLFHSNDMSPHSLNAIVPAFFRMAIQLAKLHNDFSLLKELLSKVREVNTDVSTFVRKTFSSLLTSRTNKANSFVKSAVHCTVEAAHDLLEDCSNCCTAVSDYPVSVSTLWDIDKGCISSSLSAICANQSASFELALFLVDSLSTKGLHSSSKTLVFDLKCLRLLCSNENGGKVAAEVSTLVRQRLNVSGLEKKHQDLVDALMDACAVK